MAGRLKDVLCEEGQLVELGALLATIEQDDGDASA
jgi:pyruvate/2-oxoglutarate dehydrogenase complex dihydrolipoamide acyltransferase (E2) component